MTPLRLVLFRLTGASSSRLASKMELSLFSDIKYIDISLNALHYYNMLLGNKFNGRLINTKQIVNKKIYIIQYIYFLYILITNLTTVNYWRV